ncbi:hypothetical protein [Natronoflexus pectinivorans]|uniref:Outer membrane protein with beta-barrel domain n=1 Tax=Natronoflexus pectinivorans TaxID=682526 RepID=A0A4R2GKK7_9BACT|nr:hypothetical protein [Natronoflexus pectinivorans]TCO08756.1 hypothetical protein EV194_10467 [Natronoflexus pectinivorans]
MYTINKKWLLVLLLMVTYTIANSQVRRGYRGAPFDLMNGLSVTAKVGPNIFFGDLVDEGRIGYTAGIVADREMTRTLSARAQLMGGVMQGTQIFPTTGEAYAEFDNMYFEFTFGGTYRPLNDLMGYFKERTFQPYALLQAGFVYYNASEYWGPASVMTSGAEPGEKWRTATGLAPIVGAGGGASIWLSPRLSANFEFAGNLAFSDKLDAHDVWYDSWDPLGTEHDTDPYDFYYSVTLGITYLIQDSPFRNEPRFNRRSYMKTRRFFQPKTRSRSSRPSSHMRRRWLFF